MSLLIPTRPLKRKSCSLTLILALMSLYRLLLIAIGPLSYENSYISFVVAVFFTILVSKDS